MIAATEHDKLVVQDYQQLGKFGIRSVRDGLRWHLIETSPGHYDWSSFLPMLQASRDTGTQVIWDLCHYGCPDDVEIWSPAFIRRFAAFAREAARIVKEETDAVPFYAPMNEISFWSWAGGDVSYINPFGRDKGKLLKRQLIRAAVEAIEAVSDVEPRARLVYPEPVINIIADPKRPQDRAPAEAYRLSQFQAWDMISGRLAPELGGQPKYLDIIGVNYYWNNQWMHKGRTIERGNPLYRPFKDILAETYRRYERPIFVAETGIEHEKRPSWLRYVCEQSRAAISEGIPLEGICLYPVMNHPGWDNDRHTQCGMLDFIVENDERSVYHPLVTELRFQQTLFDSLWQSGQQNTAASAG